MSPRETVEAKAARLLAAGRLFVERVDDAGVAALCAGDGGVYELVVDADGASCSCAATVCCSHLIALEAVVHRGLAGTR